MLPVREIETPPPWLASGDGSGPVVISTRVRLARNLHDVRFVSIATPDERSLVVSRVMKAVADSPSINSLAPLDIAPLKSHERLALHERYLIPKALVTEDKPSALLLSRDEGDSIVVNEEDHLRMQALRPGLAPEQAWDAVDVADDMLDSALQFAFDPNLGYLTACPTNVGTGLRVSALLHLPGLVLTGRVANVTAAVLQGGFTVRGMHGEGTDPAGYFFQVSNQRALGKSEGQIVTEFRELARHIEEYEQKSRRKILAGDRTMLEDRVSRARAVLEAARVVGSREAISLLATLRLGVAMGLLDAPATSGGCSAFTTIDHLVMLVQPGHLQTLYGGELSDADRDRRRPDLIRKHLLA